MGWNYRVMRHKSAQGQVWFGIHEAYYNDEGEVTAWTDEPSQPCGETMEELKNDLGRMLRATDYPVIDVPHEPVKDRGCGND